MSATGLYRALGWDGYVVLDTWQSSPNGSWCWPTRSA